MTFDSSDSDTSSVSRPAPSLAAGIDPYALALGLLRSDLGTAIPFLLLLMVPALLTALLPPTTTVIWCVLILERSAQVIVASIVVTRWRRRLGSSTGWRPSFGSIAAKNLVIGFALWSACIIPVTIMVSLQEPVGAFASLLLLLVGVIIALRFFFYFVTSAFCGPRMGEVLVAARDLTLLEPKAPLKAIVGPLALTALLVSFFSAPYPDGRSMLWSFLTDASEAVFWVLSCYTGLSFGLLLLDRCAAKPAGLDPYLTDRLKTLEVQGRLKLSGINAPKNAAKVLLLSVLIFVGNFSRQLTMDPGPKIEVQELRMADKRIELDLSLVDTEFEYRGFIPAAFVLAGESGRVQISTQLVRASLEPTGGEKLMSLPPSKKPVVLHLAFATERSVDDIRVLEDLWLWYQLKPFIHLTREKLAAAAPIATQPVEKN